MRSILAVPISIHLIPSATRNAAIFHPWGAAAHEPTALFSEIPSTACNINNVLAASIVVVGPNHTSAETRAGSERTKKRERATNPPLKTFESRDSQIYTTDLTLESSEVRNYAADQIASSSTHSIVLMMMVVVTATTTIATMMITCSCMCVATAASTMTRMMISIATAAATGWRRAADRRTWQRSN